MVSEQNLKYRVILWVVLKLYSGKVKSIGVSNFSEVKLEEILQTAEIVPVVNQANRLKFLSSIYERVLMCPY